jgi:hypothetical protein
VTADPRVTAAREFLDAIRPYPVADRPVSVLRREDAELRRMLGRLLAVIDGQAPALTAEQLAVLRQALGDGIAHREPGGFCIDCDAHPAGLCVDHAEDLDRCDAYGLLAKALGVEL